MIRSRIKKAMAGVISAALAFGGVCLVSTARADTNQLPGTNATQRDARQEQFDRDKVTLKDQAEQSISSAEANIDALKRISSNQNGQMKRQNQDAEKKVSMLRDHLKSDLNKIDKASINDWNGVRPVVERDLAAMQTELQQVAPVTNVPPPAQ